jgi:hypothetical protein
MVSIRVDLGVALGSFVDVRSTHEPSSEGSVNSKSWRRTHARFNAYNVSVTTVEEIAESHTFGETLEAVRNTGQEVIMFLVVVILVFLEL